MKITTIHWEIKCSECGKAKQVKEDPCSETYVCERCKETYPEPNKANDDNTENLKDYLEAEQNYRYITGKTSSAYKTLDLKKELFKCFEVKGTKAERAYELACEYSEDSDYDNRDISIYNVFNDLIDLIK